MEPANPPRTDVLVVIPCLNEQSYINSVISTVLADPAQERFAVVVCDGGSTDQTGRIVSEIAARNPRVRLIANSARIQSAGINLAACLFGDGHRWLVRMDAHAEYPPDYISTLISEAERTKAASVVVAMKARGIGCFQRAVAAAQNSILGAGGSPHRRDGAEGFVDHGHHALIDFAQFRLLHGYDEHQSHNEDAEFDARLRRAGGAIWLTRATQMTYFPRAQPRGLFVQYSNHGRGRALTMLRHRMWPKTRQLLPALVAPSLVLAAFAPFASILAWPALAWLSASLAFGICLGVKERSPCALAAGLAALIMHLGWSIGFWSAMGGRLLFAAASPKKMAPAPVR